MSVVNTHGDAACKEVAKQLASLARAHLEIVNPMIEPVYCKPNERNYSPNAITRRNYFIHAPAAGVYGVVDGQRLGYHCRWIRRAQRAELRTQTTDERGDRAAAAVACVGRNRNPTRPAAASSDRKTWTCGYVELSGLFVIDENVRCKCDSR